MAASPVIERLTVRPLEPAHIRSAARLHAVALPHGFFARLGVAFLRAYYASFAASPHAVGFVAFVEGRPAGVLVGTLRNRAHYRWVMRRRGLRLGARAALALLARPRLAAHFLRTRAGWYRRATARMLRRRDHTPPASAGGEPAVLSHVCVAADARGRGVGGALVDAFVRTARDTGATEGMLVTLAGNRGASSFYERAGWTLHDSRTDVEGRPVAVYRRALRPAPS